MSLQFWICAVAALLNLFCLIVQSKLHNWELAVSCFALLVLNALGAAFWWWADRSNSKGK